MQRGSTQIDSDRAGDGDVMSQIVLATFENGVLVLDALLPEGIRFEAGRGL
jgi:hypothetical protein